MDKYKTYKLSEIATVQTGPFGSQLHREDYVEIGTPIITVEHLGENRIVHENLPRVCDEDKERLSKYSLRTNDIVFSRVGSVDRRAFVSENEDGWLFSGRCLRVRTNSENIDSKFLSFYFGQESFKEYIRGIAVGATMPSINTKILSDIQITLPSIEEQKAIAKILSSLDDKIELNRQMNRTLEAMARAVFKAWFVDFEPVRANSENRPSESASPEIAKLFPSEFENDIPKGWELRELREAFEINPFRKLVKGQTAKFLDMANVPIFGHSITNLSEREFYSGMKFIAGDTLLARITPCLENGKTAFVDFLNNGEVGFGSTEFIVLRPKNLPEYFAYLLCRDEDFRAFAIQSMTGTSGRQRVQTDQLASYKIALPSNVNLISKKLGDVLTPMVHRISQNSVETKSLSQIRDSLLPRLISGKIKVGAAESETVQSV